MAWQKINQGQPGIGPALTLLQNTADGYGHLTETILNNKMQDCTKHPHHYYCLHLWSYGSTSDPTVSAFFFLRRRMQKGDPQQESLWAYMLSIGAKDSDNGGLSPSALRDALNDVSLNEMKPLAPAVKRELMHLPPKPGLKPKNLQQVYDELVWNAHPPKKNPRLEYKGIVTLGSPWVPMVSGTEVFHDFMWFEVFEDPGP
jgi:hypothetical protein